MRNKRWKRWGIGLLILGAIYLLLASQGVVPWFDFTPWSAHLSAGQSAMKAKHYLEAEKHLLAAVNKSRQAPAEKHGDCLLALATLYIDEATVFPTEQKMTAWRAMKTIWRSLGPGGPAFAKTYRNTLLQMHVQQNVKQIDKTIGEAKAAYAAAYGSQDIRYVRVLWRIANVPHTYDDTRTMALLREAYRICMAIRPPDDPEAQKAYNYLWVNTNYSDQKQLTRHYLKQFTIHGRANTRAYLDAIEQTQLNVWEGDASLSAAAFTQAVALHQRFKLPFHIAPYQNHGYFYANIIHDRTLLPATRESLARQLLDAVRKLNGADDLTTGEACALLADMYVDQKRYPEAERLYRETIAIGNRKEGRDAFSNFCRGKEPKSFSQAYYWDTMGGYMTLLDATGHSALADQIGMWMD